MGNQHSAVFTPTLRLRALRGLVWVVDFLGDVFVEMAEKLLVRLSGLRHDLAIDGTRMKNHTGEETYWSRRPEGMGVLRDAVCVALISLIGMRRVCRPCGASVSDCATLAVVEWAARDEQEEAYLLRFKGRWVRRINK
jgi:hypothetical protein